MGNLSTVQRVETEEEEDYEDIVQVGRLDSGNLFFGTSLFAGWDEEEILGLPPANGVLQASTKPPEHALSVRSSVNTRKESLKFVSNGDGKTGTLQFVFDNSEPCTMKLKFKPPNDNCVLEPQAFGAGLSQFCQVPLNLEEIQFQSEETEDKQRHGVVFSIVLKCKDTLGAGTKETSEYDIRTQVTSCSLNKLIMEDGSIVYDIKVLQQAISHNGTPYVIYDIFGLENATKETDCCVICMTEEKNTICIPCRHLCVCQDCAQVLKFQSNKCPICRTPVRAMLHVKISTGKKDINVPIDSEDEIAQSSEEEALTQKGDSLLINVEESSSFN